MQKKASRRASRSSSVCLSFILGATLLLTACGEQATSLASPASTISPVEQPATQPTTIPESTPAALEPVSVQALGGTVELLAAGGDSWQTVAGEQPVELGPCLRTGQNASALLLFAEGSRVIIQPNSQISLTQFALGDDFRVVKLHLADGKLIYGVAELGYELSVFQIVSPGVVISIHGTSGEYAYASANRLASHLLLNGTAIYAQIVADAQDNPTLLMVNQLPGTRVGGPVPQNLSEDDLAKLTDFTSVLGAGRAETVATLEATDDPNAALATSLDNTGQALGNLYVPSGGGVSSFDAAMSALLGDTDFASAIGLVMGSQETHGETGAGSEFGSTQFSGVVGQEIGSVLGSFLGGGSQSATGSGDGTEQELGDNSDGSTRQDSTGNLEAVGIDFVTLLSIVGGGGGGNESVEFVPLADTDADGDGTAEQVQDGNGCAGTECEKVDIDVNPSADEDFGQTTGTGHSLNPEILDGVSTVPVIPPGLPDPSESDDSISDGQSIDDLLAVCRRDKYFYNMNSPTGQNEQLIATKQA